jgi:hypothetical protein
MPLKKVGVTRDLDSRRRWYRKKLGFHPVLRILETLFDATDEQAGDREWWWADQLGYRRGVHFTITLNASASPGSLLHLPRPLHLAAARKGGLRGACAILGQCPHCGATANLLNLHRLHLDRCPKKRTMITRPTHATSRSSNHV